MSRDKKYLPATGPQNVTTRPAARPAGRAPAHAPAAGGASWIGLVALVLVAGLVGALLFAGDEATPGRGTAPEEPAREVKGDPWKKVLAELAARGDKKWEPEPWAPASEADRLVDRFVALKKAADAAAHDLLGGKALAEGEVIGEADLEPRATDTFLRQPLTLTAIYRGEPDGQRATPDRYTLTGVGPVRTPIFRVRWANGDEGPSSSFITKDFELVVEVRGGKIHGVRSNPGR